MCLFPFLLHTVYNWKTWRPISSKLVPKTDMLCFVLETSAFQVMRLSRFQASTNLVIMNCGVWRDIALNLEFFGVRKACESKDALHPPTTPIYATGMEFIILCWSCAGPDACWPECWAISPPW